MDSIGRDKSTLRSVAELLPFDEQMVWLYVKFFYTDARISSFKDDVSFKKRFSQFTFHRYSYRTVPNVVQSRM